MSSNAQLNIAENYVLNPLTRRSIVKGGRVYNKLVKDGHIVPNQYELKEPPILQQHQQIWADETPQIEEEKDEIVVIPNEEDNDDEPIPAEDLEQLIANSTEQQVNGKELSDMIAKASQNVMEKYKDKLDHIQDDETLYEEVKKLINAELKSLLYI